MLNDDSAMEIPENVKRFADEHRFGPVRHAGEIGNDTYYERPYEEDEEEISIVEATGFPDLLMEDANGTITWICGPEVFPILKELFGDEMI